MLNVTLNNPEVVRHTLEYIGEFAHICKSGEELTNTQYKRIGLDCVRSGHMSPVRSVQWNFTITGMSRVASHQLVRHHVGIAINQQSNVFQSMSFKDSELLNQIVVPDTVYTRFTADETLEEEYENAVAALQHVYTALLDRGVSSSDARYLIPQGQETAINISVTPEALIHIAHERLCRRAQWEIRKIVQLMCAQVTVFAPEFGEFLMPKCVYLHGCNERKECGFYKGYELTHSKSAPVTTTAPIEKRISIYKCDNCGAYLAAKDDDVKPFEAAPGKYLCRKCLRESLADTEE